MWEIGCLGLWGSEVDIEGGFWGGDAIQGVRDCRVLLAGRRLAGRFLAGVLGH